MFSKAAASLNEAEFLHAVPFQKHATAPAKVVPSIQLPASGGLVRD